MLLSGPDSSTKVLQAAVIKQSTERPLQALKLDTMAMQNLQFVVNQARRALASAGD
jgi:hypothetical protein